MIEHILVRNFKSLDEVAIDFVKFNCFVGMNGAGKTTILQAIDFIAQQMRGDISGWLSVRGWDANDLHCKTRFKSVETLFGDMERVIDLRAAHSATVFIVKFRLQDGNYLNWGGAFSRKTLRLTRERVWIFEDGESKKHRICLEVDDQHIKIGSTIDDPIRFDYEGSVLSQLKEEILPPELTELKNYFASLRSLELLSPHLLRKRSRDTDRDIGSGGERLSGYLNTIKGEERAKLIVSLKRFYPRLTDYRIASKRGGWKSLIAKEDHDGVQLETEAKHLNDGLLRILAILAQESSGKASLVLLDEIENGINPEIVEALVDTLVDSKVQIVVTTHSPMVLNYLQSETARKSVQFVYKTETGHTRVRRFFEIPSIAEKLNYMGPGEAFVDTDLVRLTSEAVLLDVKMLRDKQKTEARKAAEKVKARA